MVLEELPENREIVGDAFDALQGRLPAARRRSRRRKGAFYVDFVDDLGLVNEDFRDLTHLVESGRAKWTEGLAEALCPAIAQADEGEAGP